MGVLRLHLGQSPKPTEIKVLKAKRELKLGNIYLFIIHYKLNATTDNVMQEIKLICYQQFIIAFNMLLDLSNL